MPLGTLATNVTVPLDNPCVHTTLAEVNGFPFGDCDCDGSFSMVMVIPVESNLRFLEDFVYSCKDEFPFPFQLCSACQYDGFSARF